MKSGPFTQYEKDFILSNYQRLTQSEIARALGRHRGSIARYVSRRKLKTFKKYRYWSKGDIFKLFKLAERYSYKEIAKMMGRTPDNVDYMLTKLQVPTRTEVFSLRRICRETGYDKHQLYRAKKALRQTWPLAHYRKDKKASKPMSRYRIKRIQVEALCEYLKHEV